jgi:hypothetical protein
MKIKLVFFSFLFVAMCTPTQPAQAKPGGFTEWLMTKEKNKWAMNIANRQIKKIEKKIKKKPSAKLSLELSNAEERYARARCQWILENPTVPYLVNWLEENPFHLSRVGAQKSLGKLYIADADSLHLESVFMGIAISDLLDRALVEQDNSRNLAADIAYETVMSEPDSLAMHGFLLRYPDSVYSTRVAAAEQKVAFQEAERANSVESWSDFLRRYPDHEQKEEAEVKLKNAVWTALSNERGNEALWAYAREFPDSVEGWNAAKEAMTKSTVWRRSDGNKITAVGLSDRVIRQITLDLGGVLPPGYKVDFSVSILSSEGEVQQSWNEVAEETAQKLKVALTIPTDRRTSSVQEGAKVIWETPYPICSANDESVTIRACATLTRSSQKYEECREFTSSAKCNGGSQLAFLSLKDDIAGPFASIHYDPVAKAYSLDEPPVQLPESWDCSHIATVDVAGAEVICGAFAVRIGWQPGTFWVRSIDPSIAMSERVELVPYSRKAKYPFRASTKNTTKSKVYAKRKVIALQNGRLVTMTPPNDLFAFAVPIALSTPTSRIDPGIATQPTPSGIPVPVGAKPIESTRIAVPKKIHELLASIGQSQQLVGYSIETRRFSETKSTVVQSGISNQLIIMHTDSDFDWHQVIKLPYENCSISGAWFSYDNEPYYRAIGTGPDCPYNRVSTLRWEGSRYVIDVVDLPTKKRGK